LSINEDFLKKSIKNAITKDLVAMAKSTCPMQEFQGRTFSGCLKNVELWKVDELTENSFKASNYITWTKAIGKIIDGELLAIAFVTIDYKEILKKSLLLITAEDLKTASDGWLEPDDIKKIFIAENWETSCYDDNELSFNCMPFEDQLRLYVSFKDSKIGEISLAQE